MEFSEHELTVMKGISDPETMALLHKIFVDMPSANFAELSKNIVALDNREYGELMKIVYLTKKDNESRIEFIKKATKEKSDKPPKLLAPK